MKNPKISLVIPAYNEEKYIGDCLTHVIQNGGGRFFEIIVIDNASTDKTSEIASGFPLVRVVQEPNKGLTKARQRGFLESKGDVIAMIDADTRMPKNWFSTLIREFSNNDKLACLSGPYVYYDQSWFGQLLVKIYYFFAIPLYFFTGYMATGGNFSIRRDVLEKMGGFDTSIAFYGEDTDIARRASKHGKVKFMLKFKMYTSARRLKGQGVFATGKVYALNFFSTVLKHKPTTENYTDIR